MKFMKLTEKITSDNKKMISIIAVLFVIVIIGGVFYGTNSNASLEELSKPGNCSDSDGNDIFKKGAVVYADDKGRHAEEDYCVENGQQVYEWTCERTALFSSLFKATKTTRVCKKGCNNGACIK